VNVGDFSFEGLVVCDSVCSCVFFCWLCVPLVSVVYVGSVFVKVCVLLDCQFDVE
jgi:hypothetical protein